MNIANIIRRSLVSILPVLVTTMMAAPIADDALSPRVARMAPGFRGDHPVRPVVQGTNHTIFAEAEEFQAHDPGWVAQDWGDNYYSSTFAITFLSRKAFLGAPEQGPRTEGSLTVTVPRVGRYLALVRYEAAYRFETQFTLRIVQNGAVKLERLYGARDNEKIWAFKQKIKKEVAWPWGAVENIVWEGHEAFVDLEPGLATLSLIADDQPEPAARRNVDLVMLTDDLEQVARRIDKEGYLPLDGMLTQAGDVFLRAVNEAQTPITLKIPPTREHSPYWVHLRQWKPLELTLEPAQQSEWIEVGGLMDALNDGQWWITATPQKKDDPVQYRLEIAWRSASDVMEPIGEFVSKKPTTTLLYDANTRYTRRIRPHDSVLNDVLAYLDTHPVDGKPPRRLIVYGYTFDTGSDADYNARVERFVEMIGLTRIYDRDKPHYSLGNPALRNPSGYLQPTRDFDAQLESLRGDKAIDRIRTVSLGDEIALARPPADDHDGFRAWAKEKGLAPRQLGAADWDAVQYHAGDKMAGDNPGGYYYSQRYAHAFGIAQLRKRTERIRAALPNADTGANFSPHHGGPGLSYTGEAHKWITLFREGGMTMPWSEDYIWQLPVGSQQMNFLLVDLFRAGLRYRPEAQIHMYVMPHRPGNRTDSWRRLWYGNLGSGMKIANLFEFRPPQVSYTENYVNDLAMYREVRRAIYETAGFEDIVLDGHVRWGQAALWYSDSADAWGAQRPPFGANKRSMYVAIRHRQLALDVVDEEDALRGTLDGYRVLYLTDSHVSDAASRAIAAWVARGGRLFATVNGGLFNQYNAPNAALRELYGIEPAEVELPADSAVGYEKQDLPFARVFDRVAWTGLGDGLPATPVVGARTRVKSVGKDVETVGIFDDGSPAVVRRRVGKGQAFYAGFPAGLSYFQPAIPLRPADRSTGDASMSHFIPTAFDAGVAALVGLPAEGVARAVTASAPLVQASVIDSPHGLAIPLVNWSGEPQPGLTVSIADADAKGRKARLAGGGKVERLAADRDAPGRTRFRFDLDAADALLLR